MIEFGKTLKAAREAKGLAIADIAAQTHMMSSMIADLENDDFSRLAAPIYGRGFVKLYCEAVGLAPEPMIAEFMDIYNGNRKPTIRERAVPAAPAPAPAPEPAPAPVSVSEPEPTLATSPEPRVVEPSAPQPATVEAAEPPADEQLDLFSVPPPVETFHPEQPVRPVQAEVPVRKPVHEREVAQNKEHPFAHYATPFRECASKIPDLAPAFGRWLVVVVLFCLVVGGLVFGIRALYCATSTPSEQTAEAIAPAAVEPPTPVVPAAADAKTSRTPMDVPPLYID